MPGLMRRTMVLTALGALLAGCPGSLDPRFFMDAGVDGGGVCPDVETKLFVPTCGGAGCHENPGAAGNLDLVSPGVGARLKAAISTCQAKPMISYMIDKVKPAPTCGAVMPLGSDPLGPNELRCLQAYLDRLVDGGI